MTAFQRHIVKRGKQNAVSIFFHRKDDRAAIATLRLDLDKFRQVFDVGSFTSLSHRLLTCCVQTELATSAKPYLPGACYDASNPHVAVPDPQHGTGTTCARLPEVHDVLDHDVVRPEPVVSGTQGDPTGTRTFAPNESQGKRDDRNRAVSTTVSLLVTGWLLITAHRLGLRNVSDMSAK